MKRYLLALVAITVLPLLARAQMTPGTMITPTAGLREFTLGGSGATNNDFDESFGGMNFSYGQYLSPTQMWVLRQTINYANPDRGSSQWNGATRLAFDQHFTGGARWRPFVGANLGGVYGDAVRDTWAAGLEAGAKYYVQERTFIYAMVEYGWFFRKAKNVDDTFRDGQFNGSLGIGFNF